ncbi:MAG: alpha/beta fold hydrolase [Pseudomonadota bacterium]
MAERVTFAGAFGDELSAALEAPSSGRPRGFAIFAHCFSCSKDVAAARRVSRALAARGFGVLRFDFTGLGNSGGDFSSSNFSSNVEDLVQAAAFMKERGMTPELLVGHSLGGAATLIAAARLPEVRAVATIGAPAEAEHVAMNFGDKLEEISQQGSAEVSLAGRPFQIRKQFLDDLAQQKVTEAAASLKRPLLVMHAPLDETVGVDHATRIFVAAKHPKSFVSLDDADHLLSRPADAEYAAGVLSAWAARFIGGDSADENATAKAAREDAADASEGWAISRESGEGRLAQAVTVGGHTFTIDGGVGDGGNDLGPNPTRVVEAALAACASITARLYADRKGWPLERARVRVRPDPDVQQDAHVLKSLVKEARFEGDLSPGQRDRILEIADKCPVHRMLTGDVAIRSVLSDTGDSGGDGD